MANYGYGVDVGGTAVKLGRFTSDGKLVEKWSISTDITDSGANVLADIANTIKENISANSLSRDQLLGVGIGFPGTAYKDGTASAVNIGWNRIPLISTLEGLLGLQVKCLNDANAAALGEMWAGSGKGFEDLLMVTLGTGVGGGVIIGGRLLIGAHCAGGEIGHIPIEPAETRQCNCGSYGCFEQYASATGNVRLANDILASTDEPSTLRSFPQLSSKICWDQALAGDKVALQIAERFCYYLGRGLAAAVNAIDPQVVLIGGGVSKTGQPLIDMTEKYFRAFAFPACRDIPLRLATLGNDAGIYGCVYSLMQ